MADIEGDKIQQEQQELSLLIEKGVVFRIPRRGLARLLHRGKDKEYRVRPFTVGVMALLTNEFIRLDIDPEMINTDPRGEIKRMVLKYSGTLSRIAAIAVLGSSSRIAGFTNEPAIRMLARKLLWGMTSQNLLALAQIINAMYGHENFITSIGLMKAMPRMTAPNPIESKKEA